MLQQEPGDLVSLLRNLEGVQATGVGGRSSPESKRHTRSSRRTSGPNREHAMLTFEISSSARL
jgi:hypothetical protein